MKADLNTPLKAIEEAQKTWLSEGGSRHAMIKQLLLDHAADPAFQDPEKVSAAIKEARGHAKGMEALTFLIAFETEMILADKADGGWAGLLEQYRQGVKDQDPHPSGVLTSRHGGQGVSYELVKGFGGDGGK